MGGNIERDVSKTTHIEQQQAIKIRRRSSDDSIRVDQKPPKYKLAETKARDDDAYYDDLMKVIEENEVKGKPKKLVTTATRTNKSSLSTTPTLPSLNSRQRKESFEKPTTPDEFVMKKPKKKVMISSDIERYDLSSADNDESARRDVFEDLDDFMNEMKETSTKSTTKKKSSSSSTSKKAGKSSMKSAKESGEKVDNYDPYDFEID